jgi:hypothetical protein
MNTNFVSDPLSIARCPQLDWAGGWRVALITGPASGDCVGKKLKGQSSKEGPSPKLHSLIPSLFVLRRSVAHGGEPRVVHSRFKVRCSTLDVRCIDPPSPRPSPPGEGEGCGARRPPGSADTLLRGNKCGIRPSMFHVRCWMLDVRCWMLVVGFLTLITRQLVSRPQLRRLKAARTLFGSPRRKPAPDRRAPSP